MRRIAASRSRSFSTFAKPVCFAAAFSLSGFVASAASETPAITALRQRAESGDADSINALGDAYARGDGVDQDDASARRYYKQAADRGHVQALYNLGVLAETGQGMRVDSAGAFRLYLKAAEQGYAPAQLKIGEMFANGVGTVRDDISAVMWFKKAAASGAIEANYQLGLAYEQGRGVAKDRQQAQQWYRSAADRGYARARFNLALLLESGLGGKSDTAAAADLYRAAAVQGFAAAQNNYGLMLAEGRGDVPANLVESYAWLTIAAENGANVAARNLVAQKLTPEQLAAANERIAALRTELASGLVTSAPAEPIISRVVEPTPVVTPAPTPPAKEVASKPIIESAPVIPDRIGSLEAQLASAEKQISALRVEQTDLQASTSRLVVDFGDLLSNAADVVRTRSALLIAEQTVKALGRDSSGVATGKAEEEHRAKLTAANHGLELARADAASALNKWSDRVARMNPSGASQAPVSAAVASHSPSAPGASAANPELEDAKKRLTALQSEFAQISKRNQDASAEIDALRREQTKLSQENAKLVEAARASTESLAAAKVSTQVSPEWQNERDLLQAGLKQRAEQIARADEQISSLQRAVKAASDAAEQTRALAAEKSELIARAQTLAAANEQLTGERDRLRADNTKLAQEKSASVEPVASVQLGTAGSAEWGKEREALQAGLRQRAEQIAAADERIGELQQAVKAATVTAAENRELASRVQALAASNEQVTSERDRLRRNGTKIEQEKNAAVESLGIVQKQLEASGQGKNDSEALAASVKDLTARLALSDQQLTDVKKSLSVAQEETAAATRAAAKSAEENAAFAGQANRVAELTATVANLNRDNDSLRGQLAQVAVLRTQSERVPELERALAASKQQTADLAQMSGQLAAAQRDLFTAKSETSRLAVRLQALEADRQNQITSLRQENSAVTTRLRQAQSTLDQIASAARVSSGGSAISNTLPPRSAAPVPAASGPVVSSPAARTHTVADGESLTRISVRYYGTGSRWTEIYAANRDVLRGQNTLRVGQLLAVP